MSEKKKEMHFYHSLEKVWIREGSEYTCKRNIVMEKKIEKFEKIVDTHNFFFALLRNSPDSPPVHS